MSEMRPTDLRGILRYVPQFREKTFVIAADGAIVDDDNFGNILTDVAVLRSLNIRTVLVHGASAQIQALAEQKVAEASDLEGSGVTDAGTLQADLVVLGLGVTPNSGLAADAGVEIGVRGAIHVNRRQQTSADGVYAAGDCAESFHQVSQRQVHIALGTVANKQGRVAGINLGGGYATFPGVVGTAVTKICKVEVARTGLNEEEARRAGFAYEAVTIDSTTRAGYFPDTKPITIKLLAERASRRVLGAQIVGEEGAAKRIDVLATAITARMTVDDVIDLDLAYAPPFSGVWDAVHIAARKGAEALDRASASGQG